MNFKFNNKTYKQGKGVPMRSHTSKTVGQFKMRLLENINLNDFREVFKV